MENPFGERKLPSITELGIVLAVLLSKCERCVFFSLESGKDLYIDNTKFLSFSYLELG